MVSKPEEILPERKELYMHTADEDYLYLPGEYIELARPDHAVCGGQDHRGDPVEVVGTGLLSRCLQRETAHLNKPVFGDRLSDRA